MVTTVKDTTVRTVRWFTKMSRGSINPRYQGTIYFSGQEGEETYVSLPIIDDYS